MLPTEQTNSVSSNLSLGGSPTSDNSGFITGDPIADFFASEPVPETHFDPKVSLGCNIRKPQNLTAWPISDIMYRIQSGTYKDAIEAIRKADTLELAKQLKLELPYFVMAELCGSRCDENVLHNTGIVFDFDDVADTESLSVLLLDTMPEVRYIFKSPRGGLKAIILFSEPVSNAAQYQKIWNNLAGQLESNTRHKPDNTPDRSRACFVSYDAELIDNSRAEAFDVDEFVVQHADAAGEGLGCRGELRSPICQLSAGFGRTQCAPTEDGSGVGRTQSAPTEDGSATDEIDAMLMELNAEPVETVQIIADISEEYVKQAIDYLAAQKILYRQWVRTGIALYNHFGEVKGKGFWLRYQNNPHYHDSPEKLDKIWMKLGKYSTVGLGTLFFIAKEHGWNSAIFVNAGNRLESFPELKYIYGEPDNVQLDDTQLPQYMQNFLKHADEITDSSHGAKITALIPTLACNIGNRIGIRAAGQEIYCSFYAMIIGESSYTRKSTTINLAVNNIMATHLDTLVGLSPKERNTQSIVIKNTTQARLMNQLSEDANRLVVKSEMAGWLQEMNKSYNSGMMLDLTNLFDGQSQNIAKMEIDAWIDKPALNILGATTPEALFKELKNNADRSNGFLPRFLYCFIRNVNIEALDFSRRDNSTAIAEIGKLGEIMAVLRNLPGKHILGMTQETEEWRHEVYVKKFKRSAASKRGDSATSYFTRIYDGYWYKLCILGFAMKHWKELREANENCRLIRFFETNKVELDIAQEAMYLCDYFYENAMPVMLSLSEGSKLQDEKQIVSLIRDTVGGGEIAHSRLLAISRKNAREFGTYISSLVEKQAVIAMDRGIGYNNRTQRFYKLNAELV